MSSQPKTLTVFIVSILLVVVASMASFSGFAYCYATLVYSNKKIVDLSNTADFKEEDKKYEILYDVPIVSEEAVLSVYSEIKGKDIKDLFDELRFDNPNVADTISKLALRSKDPERVIFTATTSYLLLKRQNEINNNKKPTEKNFF